MKKKVRCHTRQIISNELQNRVNFQFLTLVCIFISPISLKVNFAIFSVLIWTQLCTLVNECLIKERKQRFYADSDNAKKNYRQLFMVIKQHFSSTS